MWQKLFVTCGICWVHLLHLQAQTDYWGTAGGALEVVYQDDATATTTDIALELEVGKFISKELLLGVQLQIANNSSTNKVNAERHSDTFTGVGVFGRYYFRQQLPFYFFAQPSVLYNKIYSTDAVIGIGNPGEQTRYLRCGLDVGGSYFIEKNIALDVYVGMSLLEQLRTNTLSLSDAAQAELGIGLQFYVSDYEKKEWVRKPRHQALAAESFVLEGNLSIENRLVSPLGLRIRPSVAYFSYRNLAVGFAFEGNYQLQAKTSQVALFPFLRFHLPIGQNYFFVEGGPGIAANKQQVATTAGLDDFDTTSHIFLHAKAGLGIFLSKYVALQGGVRYRYLIPFQDDFDVNQGVSNIGLEVGIQYFLPSKIANSN
ncbi:MAG: hypothetical protein AAF738_08295 [Bacteroidota bacterium]